MQHIHALLAAHQIDAYLVGAAARKALALGHLEIKEGVEGAEGVEEWLVLAPRKQVAALPDLPIAYPTEGGPLVVYFEGPGGTCEGHLHCVNPGEDSQAAVRRALRRRGFRIDAMAIQVAGDGTLHTIDPFGAQTDLQEKRIQVLEGQDNLFARNARLMLRCGALVAELGVEAPAALQAAATQEASRILYSPREAWRRECTALLCQPHAGLGLAWLYNTRLLGLLLPEVHAMVGFHETSRFHHKDLWAHTRQVVEQAEPVPLVRWAALLHDAGKTWTRTYDESNAVHFFQHEELGAVLVEGIAARFGMDAAFADALAFLVRHHQRPNAYKSDWTDAAVRRLIRDAGDYIAPMLRLSQADFTSARPKRREEAAKLAQELQARARQIIAEDSYKPPLPSGIGKEVMDAFSLTPGPHIGQIKKRLEAAVEAGSIEAHLPAEAYLAHLRDHPELLAE